MNKLVEHQMNQTNVVPFANVAATFQQAGAALGGASALPMLKMSKSGEWVSGADAQAVTERRFAVDIGNTELGYVCFKQGEVVDSRLLPVTSAERVRQDDLPDHGPYQDDGDGWSETAQIQMRSIESGEEYRYAPTSQGGLAAIGRLLRQYSFKLSEGKPCVPIVEIGVSHYDHKRYGKVYKPMLHVIEWRAPDKVSVAPSRDDVLDDEIPF